MTNYFFDRIKDGHIDVDDTGVEFRTADEAKKSAMVAISELARDAVANGAQQCLAIDVRSDAGRLATAHLSVWLQDHQQR